MVTLAFPLAVGVPEITPAGESDNPAGKLPALTDHAYPGVPPLAVSVMEYGNPTCAVASAPVITVRPAPAVTAGETARFIASVCVCAGDPLSDTVTVKFAFPFVAGVPEIMPALEIVRPAGRLPAVTAHV
jgi:hypothetical protein